MKEKLLLHVVITNMPKSAVDDAEAVAVEAVGGQTGASRFEKTLVLKDEELRPETVVAKIRSLFDAVAQGEFDKALSDVTDWVRTRLDNFYISAGDRTEIHLGLNAYNRTIGAGLQSVEMAVMMDGKEALLDEEIASPTIGVVEAELVKQGLIFESRFMVANRERITSFTDNLRVDNDDDESIGRPVRYLHKGKRLDVDRPLRVIMLINKTIDHIDAVNDELSIREEPTSGVYACEYKNKSSRHIDEATYDKI